MRQPGENPHNEDPKSDYERLDEVFPGVISPSTAHQTIFGLVVERILVVFKLLGRLLRGRVEETDVERRPDFKNLYKFKVL